MLNLDTVSTSKLPIPSLSATQQHSRPSLLHLNTSTPSTYPAKAQHITPAGSLPCLGDSRARPRSPSPRYARPNPSFHASVFRPGFVDFVQHDSIKGYVPPPSALKTAVDIVLGLPIWWFVKGSWSPTEPTGRFITEWQWGNGTGSFEDMAWRNWAISRLLGMLCSGGWLD